MVKTRRRFVDFFRVTWWLAPRDFDPFQGTWFYVDEPKRWIGPFHSVDDAYDFDDVMTS